MVVVVCQVYRCFLVFVVVAAVVLGFVFVVVFVVAVVNVFEWKYL